MAKIKKPSVKNSLVTAGVAIAIVALGVVAIYFYIQYQNTQTLLKNPTAAAQAEVNSLIAQVGKIVLLPTGETSTIATVSDKNKLKGQAFFAHTQNGDKLLMYTKAGWAYLYRPSANLLIQVAPLNIGANQSASGAAQNTKTATTTILNGSKIAGAAKSIETKLAADVTLGKSVSVTETGNARGDYPQTVVFDVTGKNTALVSALSKFLGGQIGSILPSVETKPTTDILIIIGQK